MEFKAGDVGGVRPCESEGGRGVVRAGNPWVGRPGGPAVAVAKITRREDGQRRLDPASEVLAAGTTLRNPEFKVVDAAVNGRSLPGRLRDRAVEFLGDRENAGNALVAEVRENVLVGLQAHEGVARTVDGGVEMKPHRLSRASLERQVRGGEDDVGGEIAGFAADAKLGDEGGRSGDIDAVFHDWHRAGLDGQ